MNALKRRVAAILARLTKNEGQDRERSTRIDNLERRMATAERRLGKRVRTLDADE